jgi:hypothetical protein
MWGNYLTGLEHQLLQNNEFCATPTGSLEMWENSLTGLKNQQAMNFL